jgi:hypothetical protein
MCGTGSTQIQMRSQNRPAEGWPLQNQELRQRRLSRRDAGATKFVGARLLFEPAPPVLNIRLGLGGCYGLLSQRSPQRLRDDAGGRCGAWCAADCKALRVRFAGVMRLHSRIRSGLNILTFHHARAYRVTRTGRERERAENHRGRNFVLHVWQREKQQSLRERQGESAAVWSKAS